MSNDSTGTFVHLHLGHLSRETHSNSYIHTLMVAAAMYGADQNIRSRFGFSILHKDTSTCRPGDLNQRPSDNKTLAPAAQTTTSRLRNLLVGDFLLNAFFRLSQQLRPEP